MTSEEKLAIESIRQTMARYTIAGDEYDAESYLTCFSENAVLEFDYFPGKGHLRLEGKQDIAQHTSGFFDALNSGSYEMPGKFARHHLTTCKIDLISETQAEAQTYCIVCTANGAEHSGKYLDRYHRIDGKWLIEYRRWALED